VKQGTRLERSFFERDTLTVARQLLGKSLVKSELDGTCLRGSIIETEAYIGVDDLACHAHAGRTRRNAAMWGTPGHAYVYFTYGMHWMFNLVTEPPGFPAAVLIRSLVPQDGLTHMHARRPGRPQPELCNGPAKLCQAFAIDQRFDGLDVCQPGSPLFLEDAPAVPDSSVTPGPRVGLNNIEEPWMSIPWRFRVDPSFARSLQPED
jgi:DNA-3-methyladenine glycosylase